MDPKELREKLRKLIEESTPEQLREMIETPERKAMAGLEDPKFLVGTIEEQKIASELIQQEQRERVRAFKMGKRAFKDHKKKWSKIKIPLHLAT